MNCKWCKRAIEKCQSDCKPNSPICVGYTHKEDGMHFCGGIAGQPIAKAEPEGEGKAEITALELHELFTKIATLQDALRQEVYMNSEICICAAVKTTDGVVYRGQRHSDAIQSALFRKVFKDGSFKITQEMQGFITSRNRFVSREEGAQLQNAARVVSVQTGKPVEGILFSEDLY